MFAGAHLHGAAFGLEVYHVVCAVVVIHLHAQAFGHGGAQGVVFKAEALGKGRVVFPVGAALRGQFPLLLVCGLDEYFGFGRVFVVVET